jgi:hypothetical protein
MLRAYCRTVPMFTINNSFSHTGSSVLLYLRTPRPLALHPLQRPWPNLSPSSFFHRISLRGLGFGIAITRARRLFTQSRSHRTSTDLFDCQSSASRRTYPFRRCVRPVRPNRGFDFAAGRHFDTRAFSYGSCTPAAARILEHSSTRLLTIG